MEARRCQSHAKGGRQQLLSSAEHAADKYCLAMPVSLQCLKQHVVTKSAEALPTNTTEFSIGDNLGDVADDAAGDVDESKRVPNPINPIQPKPIQPNYWQPYSRLIYLVRIRMARWRLR